MKIKKNNFYQTEAITYQQIKNIKRQIKKSSNDCISMALVGEGSGFNSVKYFIDTGNVFNTDPRIKTPYYHNKHFELVTYRQMMDIVAYGPDWVETQKKIKIAVLVAASLAVIAAVSFMVLCEGGLW
jgi:hypothetical protein